MTALGAVVLCLILLLWMRDRKHEMGIYLAAGIEKRDIYGQLAVESMLLYLAAFLMAVLFASVLNEALKSRLLIGEAKELVRETAEISTAGYTAAAGTAGIVITLAAVGISFLTVARMSPKEILSTN
ncbi:ABC transporter permease, partial [Mordavella massiliensis]|nr:ABC transporter permease [Mordavella massiliensis]